MQSNNCGERRLLQDTQFALSLKPYLGHVVVRFSRHYHGRRAAGNPGWNLDILMGFRLRETIAQASIVDLESCKSAKCAT